MIARLSAGKLNSFFHAMIGKAFTRAKRYNRPAIYGLNPVKIRKYVRQDTYSYGMKLIQETRGGRLELRSEDGRRLLPSRVVTGLLNVSANTLKRRVEEGCLQAVLVGDGSTAKRWYFEDEVLSIMRSGWQR